MNREDPFEYKIVDLPAKQAAFAREYLIDFNGHQAALRAGYRGNSAYGTASWLLRKDQIRDYIGSHTAASAAAVNLKTEWVLGRLMVEAANPNSPGSTRVQALTQLGKYHELGLWQADREEPSDETSPEDLEILKRAKAKLLKQMEDEDNE